MTLVIIPARMNSTRLPGKPLLKIGDRTIIERCAFQALKANFHPIIATDSEEIEAHCSSFTSVVMTGECASGTDRVAAAAEIIDPEGKHEFVINYQGDMPFLDPLILKDFVDEAEGALKIKDAVTAWHEMEYVDCNACVFKRQKIRVHIGLYGFTRNALRRFAATPQSELEKVERLEQLRDKFDWGWVNYDHMPIEINTQADLDRARSCLM